MTDHPSVFSWWSEVPRNPAFTSSSSETCARFSDVATHRTCVERQERVRAYCVERFRDQHNDKAGNNDTDDTERYLAAGDALDDDTYRSVDVLSYEAGSTLLLFCSVHKVASTYWLRVFRFLHNDTNGRDVRTPQSISKHETHLAPFTSSRALALDYVTRRLHPGVQDFRCMFVREPYHRLWAVYVDKFVLPDNFFWSHHAWQIKKMFGFPVRAKATTPGTSPCFNVSFEEFVRYVVKTSPRWPGPNDDHVTPAARLCDPCTLKPHFIGHFETLAHDAHQLLQQLSLTDLDPESDFKLHVLNNMHTVTQFVYETVVEQRHFRHCVTDFDLQDRLLRAFILNGYLPPHAAEVRHLAALRSVGELVAMMQELFTSFNRTEPEVRAQRDWHLRQAYRALPVDLLHAVRTYYRDDFQAFGYDPQPADIFQPWLFILQSWSQWPNWRLLMVLVLVLVPWTLSCDTR